MEIQELLRRRIENIRANNKSLKLFSWILFLSGVFLVVLPFLNLINMENAMKYAQHGFGLITAAMPIYLQGLITKGRDEIIHLEFLMTKADVIEAEVIKKSLEAL